MARTYKVDIEEKAFYPENTTIAKGDTVVWANRTGMNHTVTANNGEFDSGPVRPHNSFSNTFNTAGSFAYHCTIHRDMKGEVTVR